ncbi:YwmB family TATA-box binding protein [Sporolactobacillus kofuensis]|uniref:YwmB family TATA-box binding protein n=1 Tax=Sporolactobacillus kofuensis TaxID=269672 RepID=A0ABW1WFQ9_9BACL|nr:YwmB family TATA-box binding protein [Sporolactobacillus kofuensis]MCO7176326.1 YwmB family TATA-box binding protein [Sporolactobacillus kofuensis]
MKRQIVLMIVIIFCSPLFTEQFQEHVVAKQSNNAYANDLDRIPAYVKALEQRHATVEQWIIYARENQSALVTEQQFIRETEHKKSQLHGYKWFVLQPNKGVIGWKGVKKLSNHVEVRISYVAYPEENNYQTVTLYQVVGKSFNQENWPTMRKKITTDLEQIFHNQEHIYTCVKANRSAKMKLGLIEEGNRYIKLFSGAPVERLQEKTFVSISAYTKIWNNAIYTGNKKMNIQVALRNDGDQTIIALGSPIITVEY